MEIALQYFDGCPNRALLEGRIPEALADRPDATVILQRVETAEDAERLGFRGSPTVLVDGADPFAQDGAPVGLACRMYRTADGLAGSPTVEQLRWAIARAAERPGENAGGGNPRGALSALPAACSLRPGAGREQVARWRAFDDENLIGVERSETRLTVHYTRTDATITRLRELVEIESACCSFVDWRVVDDQERLRLVVTGSAEQLAALDVG
ncbi:hypothetical protein ACIP1V_05255 [Kocuria marina]|uniref:hypothetical protein n=1 Tax=Kocuria marina TaxID=223184 RepID=UPI0038178477